MALLVLDLNVPVRDAVHGQHDLWRAMAALLPSLVMYMMSFMTLGVFCVGQQTQLNHLARSARSLIWIHLVISICRHSYSLLDGSVCSIGEIFFCSEWRCISAGSARWNWKW